MFCLFVCLFRLVKNGELPSESVLFSLLLLGANRMPGSTAALSLRGRREAKGRERSEEGSCCHCCKLQQAHGGSDIKESTCNVGELGSVPGLGGCPGGGYGNPLQ